MVIFYPKFESSPLLGDVLLLSVYCPVLLTLIQSLLFSAHLLPPFTFALEVSLTEGTG